VKRQVSDAEYADALKNPDNQGIIKGVLSIYHQHLPSDSLEDCGQVGLWRALQSHRDELGNKFTTSLYRFVTWECQRELRKLNGRNRRRRVDFVPDTQLSKVVDSVGIDRMNSAETSVYVKECLALMPSEQGKHVLTQYFLQEMTYEQIAKANGYSRETARKNVQTAILAMRRLCLAV
jgi:RNA polymerase sigma factor (sigma-70 family)